MNEQEKNETKGADVRISVEMPKPLLDDLERLAAKNERSRSGEVRAAIKSHVRKTKPARATK